MVILARGSPKEAPRWPRITQPVLKRPRHVHCHLCCPDGHTQHAVVTARRHGRYGRCERLGKCNKNLQPLLMPISCTAGICIAVPASAPGETFCLWSLRPLLKSPQRVDEDACGCNKCFLPSHLPRPRLPGVQEDSAGTLCLLFEILIINLLRTEVDVMTFKDVGSVVLACQ